MPATSEQVIAGLYAAFFNRSPDARELNYWLTQAAGGNDLATFNTMAEAFIKHPKYEKVYAYLSNQEFVESIFFNILGTDGDPFCIDHWVTDLNLGLSRSSFIAVLIYSTLNIDIHNSTPGLTDRQLLIAKENQSKLLHKIEKNLVFTHSYYKQSNVRRRYGQKINGY